MNRLNIEIFSVFLRGVKDKEALVLKVRVDRSYRKFFNHLIDELGSLRLKKDWKGDFNSITAIFVTDVNNHDYSN